MDKVLERYLKKHSIKYVNHEHAAVFSVEDSIKVKEKIPGMHCKCLFLKDNTGGFYLIGMGASKRLDIKRLEKYFGVKKIRFGSAEELKKELKLTPGSVSIFGMVNLKHGCKLKFILDKEVWSAKRVGFHPNINTATLVISHEDLKMFYDSLECEKEVLEL
jgi:Ala-tRNA(Pro) deacylase